MNSCQRLANSRFSGFLLNLLLPGSGHIHFREYTFGVFVLIIWLMAAVLFYLSFIIELNLWAKLALFGLPIIFYFFTFFDLFHSMKKKKVLQKRGVLFSTAVYMIALVYQIWVPAAPLNFMMTNGPVLFVLDDHRLSPLYSQGTLMKASRLAYQVDIVGFNRPILHHLPERYDVVRIQSEKGSKANAVVLGLPEEEIEIVEGTVIINRTPDFEGWIGGLTFSGDWPLTTVGAGELLVATLNLGTIDDVYIVSYAQLVGKVSAVFE